MRATLARWANAFQLDAAVFSILGMRFWQFFAAPVTLLLIAHKFSPELQGFYYTFSSLMALQSFVELGFYIVIVNIASHEWSRLRLDEGGHLVGDADAVSRLVSLGHLIARWYAVVSLLFILGVGGAGYAFLAPKAVAGMAWLGPWLGLVAVTGGNLLLLPFNSMLEGCNQVAVVSRYRFLQVVLGTGVGWGTLWLGGGLWFGVLTGAVALAGNLYMLGVRYRGFFAPFFRQPAGPRVQWRTEVWPMQWRLAIQGVVNYFMYSLFTPVLFQYHGPVVAGKMGMTWQGVSLLQSSAQAWVLARIPQFGALVAQGAYEELDRVWRRTALVSVGFVALGGAGFLAFVAGLRYFHFALGNRMLDLLPTAIMLLTLVFTQVVQCQAAYLRAHKREPLALVGVSAGLLSGALIWLLGRAWGPLGEALAYFLVTMGVTLPLVSWIMWRARGAWHRPGEGPAPDR